MTNKNLHLKSEQALAIAEQLINSNQKQQALELLLQAFNNAPAHNELALRLARLLHQHEQNKEAIMILSKTYSLGSQSIELLYMLAALLHKTKHFKDAGRIIKVCLSLNPNSAEAYNLLGANCIELNQYDEAISAYLASIKNKPKSADAYNNLAWAYRATGQKQEAIHYFQKAFEVDPSATEALSGLLLLKTYNEKCVEFDIAKKCLKENNLPFKKKTELEFALGKAYEDIKDYKIAFSYFKRANNTWRATLDYTIESDKKLFSELKELFPSKNLQSINTNEVPESQLQPIFVLGMPRSSTTLIEQILSAHSSVVGGGELPFLEGVLLDHGKKLRWHANLTKEDLKKIASTYYNSVNQYISKEINSKSVYVTDKLPQNFRFIGIILSIFPKAKIIHCKRDPMDTCLSLFKHHFPMANHGYAYDLEELGQYYNLYEDLMAHWHQIAPEQILDVQYENLLDNFNHHVQKMLAFCGLEFEEACLEFQNNKRIVRTASSDQVRQGLYKSAAGRWLMYKQELSELKASLQSYS
jgi:tetratricopeptide (TPR) repeat protein